jgi:hypothetical protein
VVRDAEEQRLNQGVPARLQPPSVTRSFFREKLPDSFLDAVNLVIRYVVPPAFSIESAWRSSAVAERRGGPFPHNKTSFDVAPEVALRGNDYVPPESVTPFSIVVGHGGVSWAEPRFPYHTCRRGREAVVAEFGREVRLFVCPEFPERRDRGAAVRPALRADFGYLAADLNNAAFGGPRFSLWVQRFTWWAQQDSNLRPAD